MPDDWDQILEALKKEGRDIAAIDADLREICRVQTARHETGKYLMPEDLRWCRDHSQFPEKDLLKWFKRQVCVLALYLVLKHIYLYICSLHISSGSIRNVLRGTWMQMHSRNCSRSRSP